MTSLGQPWRMAGTAIGAATPVSAAVNLASLSTTGAISRSTVRLWMFNSPDAKIDFVTAWLQYGATVPNPSRKVRGRWFVSLCEQLQVGKFRKLTEPKEVINPKSQVFRFGPPSSRMTIGRPVFVQIDYEAASAAAGEVVFWDGADSLNVTINLT